VIFLPSFPEVPSPCTPESSQRIAPDGVHKATMDLLSLFINSEQQPEQKKPRMSKKKEKSVI
jgi:hypothetical protein